MVKRNLNVMKAQHKNIYIVTAVKNHYATGAKNNMFIL